MKKIVCILLVVVILVGGAGIYYKGFVDPFRGATKDMKESLALTDTLSKEEAKEDLAYLMNTLKKFHPAWRNKDKELITRVTSQYEKEVEALGDTMTVLELWRATSRIIHEMYDAHSRISLNRLEGEARYKIDGEVVSINGQSIEAIYDQFLTLWPYELESYAKTRFEKYRVYQEYLELFGVDTSKGIDVTYQTESGEETIHLEAEIYESPSKDFVSYEIDEISRLGILTLTACKQDNAQYLKALEDFFGEVQEKQIPNIIVDLRENNGGWIPVVKDFMKYIDVGEYTYCNDFKVRMGPFWYAEKEEIKNEKVTRPFNGEIYVLTGPKTFSAAMDFAMIIKDNGLGTLVGEACGNTPTSYTYNQKYQLPNSKLKLAVSSAQQKRINLAADAKLLAPDYEVAASEALQKVYEIIK